MLNWRKFIVTGAIATTLTFTSISAMAVSFDDVSSNEASISKLVSLGIVVNNAASFNPDKGLSRQEFAEIASRIMTLKGTKSIKITDVKNNAAVNNAVNAGILTVNTKGQFKPKNAVTYTDLARTLAYGLGFKSSWSNRPVDHFYFLERKGVLTIDTDLDAIVTREEAVVAIDKFLQAKDFYKTMTGVVNQINGNTIQISTGSGLSSYKFNSKASIYLDEQNGSLEGIAKGTKIHLTLNKKGEVAYAEGNSLDMLDGNLNYINGNLTLNGVPKNWLLNGLVTSLPNSPDVPLTFTEFSNYAAKAGVSFAGGMYSDTVTDEITILEPYIAKISNRVVKIQNNKAVFDFSDVALKSQSLSFADDAKFILVEGDKKTEVKLTDVLSLQAAGKEIKATLVAGADALATSMEFTAKDPEKK
ncbi:S-layer homology domain-containing protein [Pseudoneobacillus sp. C159]